MVFVETFFQQLQEKKKLWDNMDGETDGALNVNSEGCSILLCRECEYRIYM